jgi:hypothetical protein
MSTRRVSGGAVVLLGSAALGFATLGAGSATANNCSSTQATLAGINQALVNSQPGDIVCVSGGAYGFLGISGPAAGTPFSNIVLRNVPGQAVTFTGIGIANVSYLTIDGIGLAGTGQLQVDDNDTGISYQPLPT